MRNDRRGAESDHCGAHRTRPAPAQNPREDRQRQGDQSRQLPIFAHLLGDHERGARKGCARSGRPRGHLRGAAARELRGDHADRRRDPAQHRRKAGHSHAAAQTGISGGARAADRAFAR